MECMNVILYIYMSIAEQNVRFRCTRIEWQHDTSQILNTWVHASRTVMESQSAVLLGPKSSSHEIITFSWMIAFYGQTAFNCTYSLSASLPAFREAEKLQQFLQRLAVSLTTHALRRNLRNLHRRSDPCRTARTGLKAGKPWRCIKAPSWAKGLGLKCHTYCT